MTRLLTSLCALALITLLSGCSAEPVVAGIDEKEANAILVLLADQGISAGKMKIDSGREVSYTVTVSAGNKLEAMRLMGDNNHPKRKIKGYDQVFSEGGLIPTQAEEKARKLQALEGEIEQQLVLLPEILDAQVNLVMPEDSPLRANEAPPPASASVICQVPAGASNDNRSTGQQVARIVAASVENLTSDRVEVLIAQVGSSTAKIISKSAARGVGILGKLTQKQQRFAIIGVVGVTIILGVSWFLLWLKYGQVKRRFLRLQEEIARAKRKGGQSLPT